MELRLETTVRTVCDGILKDTMRDTHALYLGFDLRVDTDLAYYDQRGVAVGVHLLRFMDRILGATDNKFIFMRFDPKCEWWQISQHDSCWADSMDHYINDIVRDIMVNKDKSKYAERYADDHLIYDENNYRPHIMLSGVQLINIEELKEVQFIDDRHNPADSRKRELVPEWLMKMRTAASQG